MNKAALAAARALAEGGWRVGVGSPIPKGLAPSSRSCSAWHHVPPPQRSIDQFTAEVVSAVEAGGYDVVLPCDDSELLALSLRRSEIPAAVPYPAHEVVLKLLDKLELSAVASEAGLRVPAVLDEVELERRSSMVAVKARLHGAPESDLYLPRADPQLLSPGFALDRVAELRALGIEPVLQEVVPGPLMALTVLVGRDGGLLGVCQQRAEQTWPVGAGGSTRARVTATDGDLLQGVERMLRAAGWWGLAQLQFIDGADGAVLIDFNARFYGSLSLATAAAGNFAAGWAELALGRRPAPLGEPKIGTRYQWLEGDLRAAAAVPLRELPKVLAWAPGAVHALWRFRDPVPGMRHTLRLIGRALRSVRRSGTSSSSSA